MHELSDEEVRRIARLARLRLDDAEVEGLRADLGKVLTFMQELDAVDCSDVEPTFHTVLTSPLRDDVPRESDASRDDLLAAAPKLVEQGFAVPKVMK